MKTRLFRRHRSVVVGMTSVCLLLMVGCARPAGMGGEEGVAHADQHQAPFQDKDQAVGGGGAVSSPPAGSRPDVGLPPFRDTLSLPAGTMITVRLQNALVAGHPDDAGSFDALVDSSVVVEGNTIVPRGTSVIGRIEGARASNVDRNQGYVRLTLESLSLAGRRLPLQTSSLFARGNAGDTGDTADPGEAASSPVVHSPIVHLNKGRRLTFRLTEPVLLAQQNLPGR